MRDLNELKQEGLQEREQYVKEQKNSIAQDEMREFQLCNKEEKAIDEFLTYLRESMIKEAEKEVIKYYREGRCTFWDDRVRGINRWKTGPLFNKRMSHYYIWQFYLSFGNLIDDTASFEISPDKKWLRYILEKGIVIQILKNLNVS